MSASFYIKNTWKCRTLLCAVLLVCMLAGALCLPASAKAIKSYGVTVDYPISTSAENMPVLLKNVVHGTEPTLTVSGWVKVDQNIKSYEYTLDGGKTWISADGAVVARPDTQKFCPNTYQTAGFRLNIDVSGLHRGTYDLFVRAYTEHGDMIDVLAMLDISIGYTDTVSMMYRELNLDAFGAKDGVLALQADTPLALDAYNLRNFAYAELVLDADTPLTLKSDPASTLTFSATSPAPVLNEDGTYTATIDLEETFFAGKLLLESAQTVNISLIRFYTYMPDYYTGELNVHMTSTPFDYLSGANYADGALMSDETVGTYLRLFPTGESGDPYIYFNLGKYLKETEQKQISADHYRYAVITLQTPSTNSQGLFRLFLCAGDIHGPTGGVDVTLQPNNDGKWHKYVIPLCEEEHWTGTIYGMRFDFIDGHVKISDYANIASIEFYPDQESAKIAAAKPFEVYYEQGESLNSSYKEENRAPSGKADAITWFDSSLESCFGGENKSTYSFDEYGHLILQATESTNDPYVSFSLQQYATLTGLPMLHARDYGVIVLRIMADKKIEGKNFVLYYYSGGYNYAEGTRSIGSSFSGKGEWEYIVYDMKDKYAWTDEILGMRLDFAGQISTGQKVCLADMLFFKDMAAWEAYAKQNGIVTGDGPVMDETQTNAPETEIPTIEIPTKGPGLEYIPPEQFTDEQSTQIQAEEQGCNGIIALPALMLLSCSAFTLFKNKKKKGDQS